ISNYLQLHPTTSNYLQLPPTTSNYLQLFPTTSNYLQLPPTISNYFQQLQLPPTSNLDMPYSSDIEATKALTDKIAAIRQAVSQVIVGQDEVVHNLIISILCNGHSLLVGVPGLAKTLL